MNECPKCQKNYEDELKKCPHCDWEINEKQKVRKLPLIFLAILILFGLYFAWQLAAWIF